MKAILKFDLPEDTTEFHSAVNGGDAIAVLTELDRYLSESVKLADSNTTEAITLVHQAVRHELRRLLEEYDVSIY
jgi:hypothetical protein